MRPSLLRSQTSLSPFPTYYLVKLTQQTLPPFYHMGPLAQTHSSSEAASASTHRVMLLLRLSSQGASSFLLDPGGKDWGALLSPGWVDHSADHRPARPACMASNPRTWGKDFRTVSFCFLTGSGDWYPRFSEAPFLGLLVRLGSEVDLEIENFKNSLLFK